jgi:hypothetical protein
MIQFQVVNASRETIGEEFSVRLYLKAQAWW